MKKGEALLGTTYLQRAQEAIASFFRGFDVPVLAMTFLLVAYGLVVVYSASLSIAEASLTRQAIGVAIGLVALCIARQIDYRGLRNAVIPLLVIDCILMLLPLVPGLSYHSHGISGWIQIPGIGVTLQTAELAKPVTILLMAALVSRDQGRIRRLRDYIRDCFVLLIPFALILLQPDLGTGLVVLVSGAVVILTGGPKPRWIVVTVILLVAAIAAVFLTDQWLDAVVGDEHSLIRDYQMKRLLVFLDPSGDTSGSGYNLQQALIAVGSGGFLGKGLGNATQAGGGFLPEAHTDFVFALQAEEFGFVGSALLILAFLGLILATLRVALRCQDVFGKLICAGIAALWAFQIFENIGMCLSLMPITGIPLPFISYGSSSMVAQLLTTGIVHSIAAHKTSLPGLVSAREG